MPEPMSVSGMVRVQAASASDRGRVRDGNEDRVHVDVTRGIFAVVDGVGGHASGEIAATIAVDVIAQRLSRPLWSPEQRVREAIALANNEILTQATQSPQHTGMTCVLTVALLTERGLTIGHVGDTRLYKIDATGMNKLTHDHSPVGEREDARELSEAEAMRHPRRNEVFRDVGSAFHEPEDDGFVELIEATFEADCALLFCSDGLTDMVAASAIARVIRQHAGNPSRVAEALVLAANEAGGRDNVSVVYVEGEDFARVSRSASAASEVPEPLNGVAARAETAPSSLQALYRRLMTRGAWLVAGLIAGLGLGLAIAWLVALDDPIRLGPRTLHVGHAAGMDYGTIAAALSAASPRDTVQIEPGAYEELLVVPGGVHLTARIAGSVTLGAPAQASEAVAITIPEGTGSRVSGLRIAGTAERPFATGVRIGGEETHIEDLSIESNIDIGIDVVSAGTVAVRNSRFAGISGVPARLGAMTRPRFERDLFIRSANGHPVAIDAAGDSSPDLRDNVFVGYAEVMKSDAARRDDLLQHNLVVAAPAAAATQRRSSR
jgi:serine/threonine protein phosphatase PrpC